jgi:hypothetical protein
LTRQRVEQKKAPDFRGFFLSLDAGAATSSRLSAVPPT